MFLLSTHPEIQHKLYKEIVEVVENEMKETKNDNISVTFDMLKKMRYFDAVVFETFRIFPAVAEDAKQSFVEDTLPNGVVVPEGTLIVFDTL